MRTKKVLVLVIALIACLAVGFATEAAAKKKKKVKVTYNYASLTGCPSSGSHTAAVQLLYAANDTGPAGQSDLQKVTTACSK